MHRRTTARWTEHDPSIRWTAFFTDVLEQILLEPIRNGKVVEQILRVSLVEHAAVERIHRRIVAHVRRIRHVMLDVFHLQSHRVSIVVRTDFKLDIAEPLVQPVEAPPSSLAAFSVTRPILHRVRDHARRPRPLETFDKLFLGRRLHRDALNLIQMSQRSDRRRRVVAVRVPVLGPPSTTDAQFAPRPAFRRVDLLIHVLLVRFARSILPPARRRRRGGAHFPRRRRVRGRASRGVG